MIFLCQTEQIIDLGNPVIKINYMWIGKSIEMEYKDVISILQNIFLEIQNVNDNN